MVPPQAPGVVTSSVDVIIILPAAVQLSVAVADPVLAGRVEAPQANVIFAGQVIVGFVLSLYARVTVCVKLFEFGVVPVTVVTPV